MVPGLLLIHLIVIGYYAEKCIHAEGVCPKSKVHNICEGFLVQTWNLQNFVSPDGRKHYAKRLKYTLIQYHLATYFL